MFASRRVLSCRLSNTLTTDFCIEAVEEAQARYGTPSIFNTDQGSQFTSTDFIDLLKKHRIQISMDGKGLRVLQLTPATFTTCSADARSGLLHIAAAGHGGLTEVAIHLS
jgi:hypothetical protein